jgi:hypothetical protein
MSNLKKLSKFSPTKEATREIAQSAFSKIDGEKSPATLEFATQLSIHGVAIHKNRSTDRPLNYRVRGRINQLLKQHKLTIKRKRITEKKSNELGFGETFNFYVLSEL